jgi:hypothetical protein
LWSENQMHGVALSGALARGLERRVGDLGRTDLRPARYTVDLFRPAAMQPSAVRTTVVREGRRLCLVDAVLEQDGEPVARASGLFLKVTEPVTGEVWEPTGSPEVPPVELAPVSEEPQVPLFASDGVGWDPSFSAHQNGGRKTTWQTGVPVVPEEQPSGFVVAASIADATSMVTNWGSNGVEYINTDITLLLARLPEGRQIGLSATDRVSEDGIAVGTATVFDRRGRLGTTAVTAIANAKRAVDFEVHDFKDDPRVGNA